MQTVTVLFRRLDLGICAVAIGMPDPMSGVPTWHEASPIVGEHTFSDWEDIVRPAVIRFAHTMGLESLHGGRLAYSGEIHAMMEFDFDDPEADDETLGPCGCTDYHMADCPTRTDSFRPYDPTGFDPYDDQPED